MAQQGSALVLTGIEPEAVLKVEDISTMPVKTFAQLYTVRFAPQDWHGCSLDSTAPLFPVNVVHEPMCTPLDSFPALILTLSEQTPNVMKSSLQ